MGWHKYHDLSIQTSYVLSLKYQFHSIIHSISNVMQTSVELKICHLFSEMIKHLKIYLLSLFLYIVCLKNNVKICSSCQEYRYFHDLITNACRLKEDFRDELGGSEKSHVDCFLVVYLSFNGHPRQCPCWNLNHTVHLHGKAFVWGLRRGQLWSRHTRSMYFSVLPQLLSLVEDCSGKTCSLLCWPGRIWFEGRPDVCWKILFVHKPFGK